MSKRTIKRKLKNGYAAAGALIISAAMLIVFSSVYFFLQANIRGNLIVSNNNQSVVMAETGLREVIGLIRSNPNLENLSEEFNGKKNAKKDGDFWIIFQPWNARDITRQVDGADVVIGRYWAKAKTIDVSGAQWSNVFRDHSGFPIDNATIYHVVVEGWGVDKSGNDRDTGATIHSFVYLPTIGRYLMAVKGLMILTAGLDMSTGWIYGPRLQFLSPLLDTDPSNDGDKVRIERAEFSDNQTGFDPTFVVIDDPDDPEVDEPVQISPVVFPGMAEQLAFYAQPGNSQPQCVFSPTGNTILPPSIDINHATPTDNNRDHAYYCFDNGSGDADTAQDVSIGDVGQETLVSGQTIIATKGRIFINGDIGMLNPNAAMSKGNYTAPDGLTSFGDLPSKADQLVLYAQKGIFMRQNWCDGGTHNTAKLHGVLMVATDSTFRVWNDGNDPDPAQQCLQYDDYSFDFKGAMILGDQPKMKDFFKGPAGRSYIYLETLLSDPPPIREYYQIVREFVMRTATPRPSAP